MHEEKKETKETHMQKRKAKQGNLRHLDNNKNSISVIIYQRHTLIHSY